MKKILCILFLFYSSQAMASKWQPLQIDFNFIGISIQSSYHFNPKWSICAGVGMGIGTLSDNYTSYYDEHSHNNFSEDADILLVGTGIISPYVRIGAKYNIVQTKNRHHVFYTRYQLTAYMPTTWVWGEDKVKVNYRNGLYFGLQNFLDQQKKWNIAMEVGVGIWSNYDFCINKFGPLMNLKITYDIF